MAHDVVHADAHLGSLRGVHFDVEHVGGGVRIYAGGGHRVDGFLLFNAPAFHGGNDLHSIDVVFGKDTSVVGVRAAGARTIVVQIQANLIVFRIHDPELAVAAHWSGGHGIHFAHFMHEVGTEVDAIFKPGSSVVFSSDIAASIVVSSFHADTKFRKRGIGNDHVTLFINGDARHGGLAV